MKWQSILSVFFLGASLVLPITASANVPEHGGKSKDIVDAAVASPEHTTLVAALKAAGLVETLRGKGPFTVFAPTDSAFKKLPEGTVEGLLKPENKETLTKVLTYHVVSGNILASDLLAAIKSHDGGYTFKTLEGGEITASLEGAKVALKDGRGMTAYVTTADLQGTNGVIHVIDQVVMNK